MVTLQKLPSKEEVGSDIRIGPIIYRVIFRIGRWHLLAERFNSFAPA